MRLLPAFFLHTLACATADAPLATESASAAGDLGLQPGLAADQRAFGATAHGYDFVNPEWGFRGDATVDGVRVSGAEGSLALRFSAWGRDGALLPVAPAAPALGACVHEVTAQGDCARQLEYDHDGVVAWWANLSAGLEQGWDLQERPEGDGPVVLEVAVDGARVDGDEQELWLTADDGTAWRYSALSAWDATGAPLPAWFEVTDDGLRVLVDDTGAEWPVMVDPVLTTATTSWDGENASDNFGYAVEQAGDVNGDGYDDLVVGAYGYATSTGRVYVYHGSASGLSTTAATTLTGPAASSYFGAAARGAGDVNGDGYDDLVVGAYYYDAGVGTAYVYFGSSSGITTTGAVTLSGAGTAEYFGRSASGLGDVNGDGYDDVVVGAERYNTNIGRVYVFNGSAAFDGTADATIGGGVTSWFGYAVDGAGDVDGDGYDDMVVGAHYYSSYKGRAYVFLGSASGMGTTASATITGGSSNYYMGYDVAGAGDVDADGYDDIVVSMYGYGSSAGRAMVYRGSASGVDTTVDAILEGGTAGTEFGSAVDGAGDIDGDGYADVIVGERLSGGNVGAAYVYMGGSAGLSTTAETTLTGTAGSRFGRAVAGLGDVNGDGYGDVATGGNTLTSSTGRAWVFQGYVDADGDGYVVGGEGADQDCDDTDASVNPGAAETRGDGADGNCDGHESCYTDADADGYRTTSATWSTDTDCADAGEALSSAPTGDCDDADATAHPGATEVCDAADTDEDCDGAADDADTSADATTMTTWYADADLDTYGDAASATTACDAPTGAVANADDCDDTSAAVSPGAAETTGDGVDGDCDGAEICYEDGDDDGHRTETTVTSADADCGDAGEATAADPADDCDDAAASTFPGATETVGDGVDQDCDGAESCYVDADGDGTRVDDTTVASADTDCSDAGETGADAVSGDCNDADAAYFPGAAEADCTDPNDYNCDGSVGYADEDADGFAACEECDDGDASTNPDGTEVCDDRDNDCDDSVDEDAVDVSTWYADTDGDGYGDAEAPLLSCDQPLDHVTDATDCDDDAGGTYPGAAEIADDGIDQDCDGEDAVTGDTGDTGDTGEPDDTGDGVGNADEPPVKDDGCGCSTADPTSSLAGVWAAGLALLAARRRRPTE